MTSKRTPKKTGPKDWHPADIVAAVRKAGLSMRKLAALHGVEHGTITKALRYIYPASEKRIADAIGKHPADIWPSRYNPDGSTPLRHGRKPNHICAPKATTAGGAGKVNSRRGH